MAAVERVLIVGGGIGGLATAAGLRRAGVACEVVERTPQWAPVGAGIVLSVNAMAVMRRLEIGDALAGRGRRLGAGAITDHAGRALGRSDFAALEADFGPTVAIHRAALHEVLLAAAGDVPVTLGTSIDSATPHADGVDVRLTDGREPRYDVVIGADGLRSRVRELAFGEVPIDYAGYTCWRLVVHAPVAQVELREMWGTGLRFGVVPIDDERLYAFAVANAARGREDPAEGRLARFRERFAAFGGQVPEILAALRGPDELIHNDLEEVRVGRWARGRIVLLGDAAHAMTPNMGQGAAMALEDSAVLVEELATGAPPAEAIARYAARREPRVRWVQDQSRRIGRVGQLGHPLACRLRNAVARLVPDRATAGALERLASRPI